MYAYQEQKLLIAILLRNWVTTSEQMSNDKCNVTMEHSKLLRMHLEKIILVKLNITNCPVEDVAFQAQLVEDLDVETTLIRIIRPNWVLIVQIQAKGRVTVTCKVGNCKALQFNCKVPPEVGNITALRLVNFTILSTNLRGRKY